MSTRPRAAGPALALTGLAVSFAAVLLVPPWSDERFTDLPVYSGYAAAILDGDLPYRDLAFEYPPLAAPLMALPGIVSTRDEPYRLLFAALALVLLAGLALVAARLAAATGGRPLVAGLAVAVAPLLTGAMIRTHFDLAPTLLLAAAVLALARARSSLGLALLGVAAMTKGFPLLAAPVALGWLWAGGRRREAWRAGLVLAGVLGAVAVAAAALSPGGALDAVRYHLDRPVQVESAPASVLFALGALGGERPEAVGGFGSDNLEHPAAAAVAAVFTGLGVGALVALVLAAAARRGDLRALALAMLAVPVAGMAFAKVLSPQFLVWALPLLALAAALRERALAGTLAAATVLTLAEFPSRYADLVAGDAIPVALVAARNVLLVGAVALVLRALGPRATPAQADAGAAAG